MLLFAAILDPNNRDNTPTHNCGILSDHTFKHKTARLMACLRQCPSLNILQLQRPSPTQIKTKLGLEIFKKKTRIKVSEGKWEKRINNFITKSNLRHFEMCCILKFAITSSTLGLFPGISVYTGTKCRGKLRYYNLARSILVLQFEVDQVLHFARANLAPHLT